jgi:hypothetical protein
MRMPFTILLSCLLANAMSFAQAPIRNLGDTSRDLYQINPIDTNQGLAIGLAIRLSAATSDSARVELMEQLGNAYRNIKLMDSSIAMFKRALTLGRQLGFSLQRQTWQIGTIDYLLWETGNFTESLRYAEEEMAISRQIKDTFHLGFVHLVFGHNYASLGENRMALEEYAKAKERFREYYASIKSGNDDSYVDQCTAQVYLDKGDLDSAMYFTRLAYQEATAASKKPVLLFSTRVFGDIYRMKGDDQKALAYYRQYLSDFRTYSEWNRELGYVYNSMAALFRSCGQRDSAQVYASMALQNAFRFDDKEGIYKSALFLSDHFAGKDDGRAFQYLKMADQARDSMLGSEKMRQAQILAFNQQVRDRQQAETERKDYRRERNAIIITSAAVLLIGFLIWYYLRELSLKYKAILKQKEAENLRAVYEKQIVELEAKALRAQMNPHFIFNCMNSIKALIQQQEEDKAVNYLTTFSKLLRNILQNSDKREITLHDELEICRLYVQLEAMRFGEKLQYVFSVDERIDLKSVLLPALIIQPFIENAIWHGIMPKPVGGGLEVAVRLSEGGIQCVIDDDGIGRDLARQNAFRTRDSNHQSKGLNLVRNRLDLDSALNRRDAHVEIIDKRGPNGEAAGTRITITFKES